MFGAECRVKPFDTLDQAPCLYLGTSIYLCCSSNHLDAIQGWCWAEKESFMSARHDLESRLRVREALEVPWTSMVLRSCGGGVPQPRRLSPHGARPHSHMASWLSPGVL